MIGASGRITSRSGAMLGIVIASQTQTSAGGVHSVRHRGAVGATTIQAARGLISSTDREVDGRARTAPRPACKL